MIHFSRCLCLPPVNTLTLLLLIWGEFLTQLSLWEQFSYRNRDLSLNLSVYVHANTISNAPQLWAPHLSNVLSPLGIGFLAKATQESKVRAVTVFLCLAECCNVSDAFLSHVPQPASLALPPMTQGPFFHF